MIRGGREWQRSSQGPSHPQPGAEQPVAGASPSFRASGISLGTGHWLQVLGQT